MIKEIIIFRYGHRTVRDYRVTSHCALVARAFGAKRIIICGEKDNSIINSIENVKQNWGGQFEIEFVENWKETLNEIKKTHYLIHLTMYGEQLIKKEKKIQTHEKICLIIGSQKVEKEIYLLSQYNISITNQPHSEIAALAVTLDRLQNGKEMNKKFSNANLTIIPSKKEKRVISLK